LSLFLPTIIKGLGYSAAIAQLLTIPVYAAATITCIAVGYFADKTGKRSLFTIVCYLIILIGYIIVVAPPRFIPGLIYAGCFIAACGMYPGELFLVLFTISLDHADDSCLSDSGSPRPGVEQLGPRCEASRWNSDPDWRWLDGWRGRIELLSKHRLAQVPIGALACPDIYSFGIADYCVVLRYMQKVERETGCNWSERAWL
jgi:hypothetical protein